MKSVKPAAEDAPQAKNESGKLEWMQKKEEQARARKLAARLKRTEEEIEAKEAAKEALEEELNDPKNATNSAKLSKLHGQMMELADALDALYGEWERLAESSESGGTPS